MRITRIIQYILVVLATAVIFWVAANAWPIAMDSVGEIFELEPF